MTTIIVEPPINYSKAQGYVEKFPAFGPPPYKDDFHLLRRIELIEAIPLGVALVIIGGSEKLRNGDVYYPFRQESNFYYLTGFDEPDSVAILERHCYTLIVPPKDPTQEMWTGKITGVEGAVEKYGAHQAFPNSELKETLIKVARTVKEIFIIPSPTNESLTHTAIMHLGLCEIPDVSTYVHTQRLYKSPYEVALIRQANLITMRGHHAAMRKGMQNECEIQAKLEQEFFKAGVERVAYPSIVGSGVNATCLHYTANNAEAKEGDLVLVDAGAEYGYYAADVTRTWPISGKFTDEQKQIYNIVLEAQLAGIAAAVPGNTISDIHKICKDIIDSGLKKLGIEGDFFPHGVGHFLGLDVHDVASQEKYTTIPLESGMVITVEPGIYIEEKGIGVRIEDDILITDDGPINLSEGIIKTVEEIEAWMRESEE